MIGELEIPFLETTYWWRLLRYATREVEGVYMTQESTMDNGSATTTTTKLERDANWHSSTTLDNADRCQLLRQLVYDIPTQPIQVVSGVLNYVDCVSLHAAIYL
jgi:hypothetical protein